MNQNDETMIDKLFQQLEQAAAQTTNRDPGADAYIKQRVQQQPELLYNMVQTLILQQKALQNAKAQVESLQREKGAKQAPAPAQSQQSSQGSSFLAGAAETAVGVAGGIFLADAVGSIFDSVDYDVAADAVDDAYEAGLEDAADLDDGFGFDDLDFDF
jgi:hypothetical protein